MLREVHRSPVRLDRCGQRDAGEAHRQCGCPPAESDDECGHDRSGKRPPIGTPVCFNEKMKLRMRSGVRSARIAELEGVTGP
jgi:hypothetical protein